MRIGHWLPRLVLCRKMVFEADLEVYEECKEKYCKKQERKWHEQRYGRNITPAMFRESSQDGDKNKGEEKIKFSVMSIFNLKVW